MYRYIYIFIPTINGEINGEPYLRFSNIKEDKFKDFLEFIKGECVIYRIDRLKYSIIELI